MLLFCCYPLSRDGKIVREATFIVTVGMRLIINLSLSKPEERKRGGKWEGYGGEKKMPESTMQMCGGWLIVLAHPLLSSA